jgi:U4/U6 small nuclear ribonucleoprotein PRP3
MLVCPSAFSLVVVEGVPKALKRYHKLMLRRINWTEAPTAPGGEGEEEQAEEEEGGPPADKPANSCHLVWEVRRP